VTYRTQIDPLVRRQIQSWALSDFVWVETEIRLREHLPESPTSVLTLDPSLFEGEGMVYPFDLIDPQNRLLVHAFRFEVFYHADEQTLLVTRGAHVTATGL
jgi:hypothetical protein